MKHDNPWGAFIQSLERKQITFSRHDPVTNTTTMRFGHDEVLAAIVLRPISDLRVHVDKLLVEPAVQRCGIGTVVMRLIAMAADETGIELNLRAWPVSIAGSPRMKKSKLTAWYRRFGFKRTGSAYDSVMYRRPQKGVQA